MPHDLSRNGRFERHRGNGSSEGVRHNASPSDQALRIASDIGKSLGTSFPGWAKLKLECRYEFKIHIRNGLVQTMEFESSHGNEMPSTVGDKAIDETIAKIERWILQSLPERLRDGYHGTVTVIIELLDGSIQFTPKIMHQRKYDWSS